SASKKPRDGEACRESCYPRAQPLRKCSSGTTRADQTLVTDGLPQRYCERFRGEQTCPERIGGDTRSDALKSDPRKPASAAGTTTAARAARGDSIRPADRGGEAVFPRR